MSTSSVHIKWTYRYRTTLCNLIDQPVNLTLDAYFDATKRMESFYEHYHWCKACEDKLTPMQLLNGIEL